jgi:hypothetical protein
MTFSLRTGCLYLIRRAHRERVMKARPGEIKTGWNARERDIGFAWGADGAAKADANLLYGALCFKRVLGERTLIQELEARGYDLTTMRFSIRRKLRAAANNTHS